ncbi:MAG: hypothetical protein GC138_07760 [Gammaproteobacteria bacterium]|nr:hypothetical protein [Gammaproteobacteria bacterium]
MGRPELNGDEYVMSAVKDKQNGLPVIPFQQPPGAELQASCALRGGAPVTLRNGTGQEVSGILTDIDMTAAKAHFQAQGREEVKEVSFADIHSIVSAKTFPFVPNTEAPLISLAPRAYRIKTPGVKESAGDTLGYWVDEHGLLIYPCDPAGERYQYAFYPGNVLVQEDGDEGSCVQFEVIRRHQKSSRTVIDSWDAVIAALNNPKTALHGYRLGNIFVQEGIISSKELEAALESQSKSDEQIYLGELLMTRGLINEDDLNWALAQELGIPYVDLSALEFDPKIVQMLDGDFVRKNYLVPIFRYRQRLIVAMRNPLDHEALDTLRFQTNLGIEPVVAAGNEIGRLIDLFYADESTDALGENPAPKLNSDGVIDVAENVVVRLVNRLIVDAYNQRASDIHIEPSPDKGRCLIRLRRDGVLRVYREIPASMYLPLVGRVKVMANMDTSERRKPQDGKINFSQFGPLNIELRVATIPTTGSQEDVVLRILSSGKPIPLRQLGLTEENYDLLQEMISLPYGLFLVCGPTGSGKSTTLHSIMGYLNKPERKIWTAEDPVEITQKGLRQVQINPKIGFTFAKAMRTFLRADPDVIMVGEMRDRETTAMGIEASLTGHLVLSTLHTNSSVDSITRFLDMGMDPFNLADALIGILAQRLARRLCRHCREIKIMNEADLHALSEEYCQDLIDRDTSPEQRAAIEGMVVKDWINRYANEEGEVRMYRARGCPRCEETGYDGRVAINELLKASPAIKKMIIDRAPVSEFLRVAMSEGTTRTLKQDGIEKCLQGLTDMASVRAVCIK